MLSTVQVQYSTGHDLRDHRDRAEEGEDEDDEAEHDVAQAALAEERAELVLDGGHDALDERELHAAS